MARNSKIKNSMTGHRQASGRGGGRYGRGSRVNSIPGGNGNGSIMAAQPCNDMGGCDSDWHRPFIGRDGSCQCVSIRAPRPEARQRGRMVGGAGGPGGPVMDPGPCGSVPPQPGWSLCPDGTCIQGGMWECPGSNRRPKQRNRQGSAYQRGGMGTAGSGHQPNWLRSGKSNPRGRYGMGGGGAPDPSTIHPRCSDTGVCPSGYQAMINRRGQCQCAWIGHGAPGDL